MSEDNEKELAEATRRKRLERTSTLPKSVTTGVQPSLAAGDNMPAAKAVELSLALGSPVSLTYCVFRTGEKTMSIAGNSLTFVYEDRTIEIFPFKITDPKVTTWKRRIPSVYAALALSRTNDQEDYDYEKAVEIFNKISGRTENSERGLITLQEFLFQIDNAFIFDVEEPFEEQDVELETSHLEGEELEAAKRDIERNNALIRRNNAKAQENSVIKSMMNLVLSAVNRHGEKITEEQLDEIFSPGFFVEFLYHSFKVNRAMKTF